MSNRFLVLAAVLPLAACSQTMSTQMEYDNKVHRVQMPDDTYRIHEHPKGDRLLVSPSLGKTATAGIASGLTVGLADTLSPNASLEAAAQQYMNQTGRGHCRVQSSNELLRPVVQVIFNCIQAAPPKPA